GLGEEVCREYRIGLAARGATLARKAVERGAQEKGRTGAGLANRRGNDYFQGRLLFPIADARGRVVGFQARKLREDDPLQAKYVNSPEGELFRKGDLLYGLDRARTAIAREERALIVEGNTDVLALRQAGLGPVVASMGTALTERQLKELSRLTRKLYLCFDADAAGEAATLRGMDRAAAQGFDVRVVALPPGTDPADAAVGFEERLAKGEGYPLLPVRPPLDRAPHPPEAFVYARGGPPRVAGPPPRPARPPPRPPRRLSPPASISRVRRRQDSSRGAALGARRPRSPRSCSKQASAWSATRLPGSLLTRTCVRSSPASRRITSTPRSTAAPASTCSSPANPTVSSFSFLPSSTHALPPRESTKRPRRNCS